MSGFVSLPPAADLDPPQPPAADVVAGDGWWPDIDISQLREAVRLDTTITPARIRDAVRNAIAELDVQLADWRAQQLTRIPAPANLTEVDARAVDGVPIPVLRYTRALYSTVAADLGERLLSQSVTNAGVDRAEELRQDVDQNRRNARWAVNDLIGRRRSTVESL